MLLDQLKNRKYTETEQEVIDYLLDHLDELDDLSISDLTKRSYSSNATIIRLCQKNGYRGYKDFKVDLLKEREAQKYLVGHVDHTTPFKFNETTDEILQNMFGLYQDSIMKVYSSLEADQLKRFAECIIHKKRVFIYCFGDTQTTVLNFMNKLIKVNIFPILATQYQEEIHITKQLTKEDYALFISYRGQNRMLEDMKVLSAHHVPIGLITANKKSPLVAYSDDVLFIPDYEKENKIATFYSQLAFQYVLSNLYALIYHYIKD